MAIRMDDDTSTVPRLIGISALIDVFDQDELFELVDNQRVVELSRLGGEPGFAGTENVRKSTGISTRRILREGITPADLAAALCDRLEIVTGWRLTDFDAILLCHSHTEPDRCQRLASELTSRYQLPAGLITAFNHGCGGFLRLLNDGVCHLEMAPDGARVALISVETPEFWHDASDRLFCGIVSAGATATVLEHGRGIPIGVARADDFAVDAAHRPNPDPLFRRERTDVFSFRGERCHRTVMRMNPEPVFLNGIELMLNNLRSAMVSIDRQPGHRVIVIPHQPSGKLLRALVAAAKTEFDDVEFLNNLDGYGNTISSSVPTILSRLPDVLAANGCQPLREGDHLILLAAGICMEEIADHMTAGHACLQWHQSVSNGPGHGVSPIPCTATLPELT